MILPDKTNDYNLHKIKAVVTSDILCDTTV